MKNSYCSILVLIMISNVLYAQITSGVYFVNQGYNKEYTEYMAKKFLVNEVLSIEDEETQYVEIDGFTASKSGELTTVIYESENESGLVLAFWDDYVNELNIAYKGYSFKNLSKEKALEFLSKIDPIQEKARELSGSTQNLIYKWEDLTFIFYKNVNITKIRVFWKTMDAEWDVSNLSTLMKRYTKKG